MHKVMSLAHSFSYFLKSLDVFFFPPSPNCPGEDVEVARVDTLVSFLTLGRNHSFFN